MKIINLGKGINLNKLFSFGNNMNNNNRNTNNRCNAMILTPDKAYEMIKSGGAIVIDVRNYQEYQISHVTGSINIPVCNITNSINLLPMDKNCSIIVYCLTGARANRAVDILCSIGYKNLYMWEGGSITTMPYGDVIEYRN